MSEFDITAVDLSGILNKGAEEKQSSCLTPKPFTFFV